MLERGVAPRVVMEMLGHTTIGITMNLYSHVIPALRREAADELARAMAESV
jgi:integrase